ncbi:hypothetical protein [Tumebacillus algifaecis]|nr:hypothetical protein [Tumebacillus algifaecis]
MKKAGLLVLLAAAALAMNTATASAAGTEIFWPDPEVVSPLATQPLV